MRARRAEGAVREPRARRRAVPGRWLAAVFAAIVVSFVAATAVVHSRMGGIDRAALAIANNSAPSIEHLATARGELRHLQVVLQEELESAEQGRGIDEAAVASARASLNSAVDAYLALPPLTEERGAWMQVLQGRKGVEAVASHFELALHHGDLESAAFAVRERLPTTATALHDAVTVVIRADAARTAEFAREIQSFRRRSTYLAVSLDVACTLIALAAAVVSRRLIRAHGELVERHRRLHEERASELEDFAGRVAHDILSPLQTVAFALDLGGKQEDEQQRRRVLERGTAALDRIKKLVTGLLDFARAGGKPAEGARADLGATISELVNELQPAATQARAELDATIDRPHVVACHPGVLTSLVTNLVRNALKYMGDALVRRVEVRTQSRGAFVRVEVADTGPGLPPTVEAHVFEPYFRAPNARQPGVGLGLATVKRLAEAHGGRVGVHSVPGSGSTFWFELPRAAPSVAPADASALERRPSAALT